MQELETIEAAPTAASPHQAKFDIGSADEHVPLLGVTTHNEYTVRRSEHSQQQPASTKRRHGSLMQRHTHFQRPSEIRSLPSPQQHPQTELLVEPQPQHQIPGPLEHAVSASQQWQHATSMPQLGQHASTGPSPERADMACESCSSGKADGGSGDDNGRAQAAVAAVHGVSCERPDGKLLFQDVSFQVHPGQLLTAVGGCLQLWEGLCSCGVF